MDNDDQVGRPFDPSMIGKTMHRPIPERRHAAFTLVSLLMANPQALLERGMADALDWLRACHLLGIVPCGVHGWIKIEHSTAPEIEGRWAAHAWVEAGNMVWDVERAMMVPRRVWYESTQARDVHVFSPSAYSATAAEYAITRSDLTREEMFCPAEDPRYADVAERLGKIPAFYGPWEIPSGLGIVMIPMAVPHDRGDHILAAYDSGTGPGVTRLPDRDTIIAALAEDRNGTIPTGPEALPVGKLLENMMAELESESESEGAEAPAGDRPPGPAAD